MGAMPVNAIAGEAGKLEVLAISLARDIADTTRVLGVRSVRASIVDLETMNLSLAWSFADSMPLPTDSTFSTTPSSFAGLFAAQPGETFVRKLSPRRWAFAWRLDVDQAVFGEAHFFDRRDELGANETALLRLVCDSGIRSTAMSDREDAESTADHIEQVVPLVDSRAGARRTWLEHALLGLALLASVLAGWMLLETLPQWQRNLSAHAESVEQLERRADSTVSMRLAVALTTGDYGEVQSELTALKSLGYFEDALVTNAKRRVVASVGQASGQVIGSEIDPAGVNGRRRLPLLMGSQDQGNAWITEPPRAPQAEDMTAAVVSAIAAFTASALVALVLLLRRIRAARAWIGRLSRFTHVLSARRQ